MTQQYVTPWVIYTGDGSTVTFAYPWRISVDTDIQVLVDGVLSTNYGLTGIDAANGGNVVFGTAPPANAVVFLKRITPQTQLTDYVNHDPFAAETHESALDKITRMVQDYKEEFSRRPALASTTLNSQRNLTFPAPGSGSSKIIGWNANGTALTLYDTTVINQVASNLLTSVASEGALPSPGTMGRLIVVTGGAGRGLYIDSGTYWYQVDGKIADVKAFGATGDGVTDDSDAVQAAIASLPTGGTVAFPPGLYRLTEALSITTSGLTLQGVGQYGGTTLAFATTTGDDITIAAISSGVQNLNFVPSAKKTSGYAVKLTGNAFRCFVKDCYFEYGFNGILAQGATESKISNNHMRHMLGSRGITFTGTALSPSFRMIIEDFGSDNPYTYAITAVRENWQAGASYAQGDLVFANGNIYQCTVGGTSAGSGGPSGTPGSTPSAAFSTQIADNTVRWFYVCSGSLAWIYQDNYAYSLVVTKAACINGAYSFWMDNADGSGAAMPLFADFLDIESDHPYFACVNLMKGQSVKMDLCWLGSCLAGNGVVISASFGGEVSIVNTRVVGCWQNGILVNAGPVDTQIIGCVIGANSQDEPATYHGITLASGASRVVITNNRIGKILGGSSPPGITNPQGYGIFASGSNDHLLLAFNQCFGNTTGATNAVDVALATVWVGANVT